MRDKLLNEIIFLNLGAAKSNVAGSVDDFNTSRLHLAVNYKNP